MATVLLYRQHSRRCNAPKEAEAQEHGMSRGLLKRRRPPSGPKALCLPGGLVVLSGHTSILSRRHVLCAPASRQHEAGGAVHQQYYGEG